MIKTRPAVIWRRLPWLAIAATAGLLVAACTRGAASSPASPSAGIEGVPEALATVTEATLPAGFEKAPTLDVGGKTYTFDVIPGHYWKVLDPGGFAIGLHFQSAEPFRWARADVPTGTLLYVMYAIPGSCGTGNYAQAVKAADASIVGSLPPGFEHWHALVGGGSTIGHWLAHIPVRSFTFAGPPGNPLEGTQVTAGVPGFIPVCDVR